MKKQEGWKGWDDYADFYDWENAQTLDRRDVKFWQAMAERSNGPILELGCGTGRVTIPVARTGTRIIGIDRSSAAVHENERRPCRQFLDGQRHGAHGAGIFEQLAPEFENRCLHSLVVLLQAGQFRPSDSSNP